MATIADLSNWLVEYLRKNDLTQSDLARASGVHRQIISNYISGKVTKPDDEIVTKIAHAVKEDPEFMFRLSGLLPPKPDTDEILNRIEHLYHTLEDPGNKQKTLEYIDYLKTQEEKGKYDAGQNKQTEPR